MSKDMVEREMPQTIWRLRVAYWTSKATRAQTHARASAPLLTPPLPHTEVCNTKKKSREPQTPTFLGAYLGLDTDVFA